jgi:flagellin-like hook-associated protein FlgL
MATISDMVIRVRELMVQAANDTNTFKNREMIQLEIDQIMTEINDVTFRTQFNTRTLLAGGLGGEGGGPSSPVSLQWMVFDQARVIGLSSPGGIVTTTQDGHLGRMPNVHWNDYNRTNTSVRSEVITLQNEMHALARRVAERMANDPHNAFDKDDLSAMFEDVRNLDFSQLDMITAERTELQSISNRIESLLRTGLRASEDLYQITQDQINALGGAGAINADGSTVFSGTAIQDWVNARDVLDSVRDRYQEALDTLNTAMGAGLGGALEAMNQAVLTLVGTLGSEEIGGVVNANAAWNNAGYADADAAGNGTMEHGTAVAPNVFLVNSDGAAGTGTWSFNTMPNGLGDDVTYTAGTAASDVAPTTPGDWGTVNGGYESAADAAAGTFNDGDAVAAGVFLVENADGTWSFNTESDGSGNVVTYDPATNEFTLPAIPNTFTIDPVTGGPADAPINTILADMERLLDFATDVLGNVNLESNAMWFQIGPNAMQGMILQLQGIHTGILGGGRGDLAMLIDVRKFPGQEVSEQLAIIDIAEGIVNGQRAQLGAVQNRLEFTRQSLDISSENLSAAESRVRDTDMAKEMMRFTAAQVLQQAGISMLAQANQLPASILQLLQ